MLPVPARTRRSQSLDGLGQGSAAASIARAVRGAGTLAASQVRSVTFRSQISPDIELDPFQAVSTGQQPVAKPRTVGEYGLRELFLRAVRPALDLDTSFGVLRIAPWGEPKPLFPVFVAGAIIASFVLVGFVVRRIRRRS